MAVHNSALIVCKAVEIIEAGEVRQYRQAVQVAIAELDSTGLITPANEIADADIVQIIDWTREHRESNKRFNAKKANRLQRRRW